MNFTLHTHTRYSCVAWEDLPTFAHTHCTHTQGDSAHSSYHTLPSARAAPQPACPSLPPSSPCLPPSLPLLLPSKPALLASLFLARIHKGLPNAPFHFNLNNGALMARYLAPAAAAPFSRHGDGAAGTGVQLRCTRLSALTTSLPRAHMRPTGARLASPPLQAASTVSLGRAAQIKINTGDAAAAGK